MGTMNGEWGEKKPSFEIIMTSKTFSNETRNREKKVCVCALATRCSYLCKRTQSHQRKRKKCDEKNLPGSSSSSSAQSPSPLHPLNGNIVHCNTKRMVKAVANNRTKVNDSLKSIVNGWNDGNSYP